MHFDNFDRCVEDETTADRLPCVFVHIVTSQSLYLLYGADRNRCCLKDLIMDNLPGDKFIIPICQTFLLLYSDSSRLHLITPQNWFCTVIVSAHGQRLCVV